MIDLAKLAVALLGIVGLGLALFIRVRKSGRKQMVCYIGQDCDTVVHSEYSRFLGIPVEILGMLYYAAIAAAYAAFLISPEFATMPAVFSALALTTAAFLFSLYLTFIQGFVLREWCEWCLTSAFFCAAIFILALRSMPVGLFDFLEEMHGTVVLLHGLAAAVGVGAATVTDVLFFKFLKDLRISEEESDILRSVSQVIWLALAALLIAGLVLWLADAEELNASAKFLVKMIIVAVIIGNGALLNLWIAPRLIHISFGQRHVHIPGELRHARRFAFALGAVSITSWYSAFILGSLHGVEVGFWPLLGLYIGVVAAAVMVSQMADRSLAEQT
ncbi:MAG: vitamin K epoxide reductase family protein [Candidatus Sungbacteria bacterium]|uniref:Vitamin K epoxide reductase family protein n=1 Tax=Candidatus Sungiibacteriota bacterium TaxID=2750080 RepID=A0A933DTR9_9BACT|nr:vitamin K epoxide reductase family protein [Candidatus Sungbacteria bacterium]